MAVSLDRQIFYVPPVVAGPDPASHGPRVQEEGPSTAILGLALSPPLLQNAHDPQPSSAGGSQADAILIPTDDESDDLDSRSDTSFESLGRLLSEARSKVQFGRISGTAGKGVDAASDDHNAPDPSVASMAGLGNESHTSPRTLRAEQERLVPVSPTSRPWLECSGWSRRPVDRCPRHPNWTKFCRRFQKAKADDEGNKGGEPKPAGAGLPLPPPNSQLEADRHPTNEICPTTPPQVVESSARTPTLPDDESTGELEPAGAEPRLQPQSLSGAASGRGVDPQQRSGSCGLPRHRDHRDDNGRESSLGQPHLFAPDDRGESVACSPTQPDNESTGEPESADAELDPADAEPRLQPPSSHKAVPSRGVDPQQRSGSCGLSRHRDHSNENDRESMAGSPTLQHTVGRCDVMPGRMASQRDLHRRRHRDTDDKEDYSPSVHSDAEHSEDEIVQPPPRKRRRGGTAIIAAGGTASQQQTRLSCGDSSRGARESSRHPRRQRSAAHQPSSLARDTKMDRNAAATFEEWPLGNAVLKRVTVDGSLPTFMVQFTWDPRASHGTGHRIAENRSTIPSAQKRRTSRQRSIPATKAVNPPADSTSTSTSRRVRYTSEDDTTIRQLKEQGLSWLAIAKHFPGRTAGAIEVRYHTKLKTAKISQSESRQLCDQLRAPSPVVGEGAGEKEWEVEEICGDRRLDDGDVELLVKWGSGEETWEPYENMAETEALDRYERRHKRVAVVTV